MMFNAEMNKENSQSLFYKALAIVFVIRLIISAWLPITGDEAYFVVWGHNLDYGYYDHTPFVGWLLAAFLTISDATWWLRLPSTLLPLFVSYGIYHILNKKQSKVSVWVALTFLIAPVNFYNILITNDTPLIFFSFISTWYFYQALTNNSQRNSYIYYFLCGLFLGFAFISKYFAVFLGITYGLYIVLFIVIVEVLLDYLLYFLMVLPFVFINLLWNYNNCWSNILFNLYNRATAEADSLVNLAKYIASLVYLFSPVLIYYVFKGIKKAKQPNNEKYHHIYLWLTVIPLTLFLLLTIRKLIGLHWILSFYPFVFIAASQLLNVNQWRITFYSMIILNIMSLMIISTWIINITDKTKLQNITFGFHPEKFLNQMNMYKEDYVFSTVSYGIASTASHYGSKNFIIFGEASVHGREDDKNTDFKKLDGKNILILKRSESHLDIYKKYFESSERKKIQVDGVTFELLLGKGFKYSLYREEILSQINKDYYNIPDWLPSGSCGFKEKYNLD